MELKLLSTKELPNGTIINEYEIGNYTIWEHIRKYITFMNIISDIGVNNFLPDIYADTDDNEGIITNFTIQTTSYGTLNVGDTKRFIEAYKEAVEVVEILIDKFVNKDK